MHSASLSKQTKPNPHLFRVLTLHCFLLLPKVHVHLWGFRRAGCKGVQLSSAILQDGWGASSARRACSITSFSSLFQSPCSPKKLKRLSQLRTRLTLAPSKKKKLKKKLIPPAGWRRARSGAGRRCPRHGAARSRPLRTRGTCASSHGAG